VLQIKEQVRQLPLVERFVSDGNHASDTSHSAPFVFVAGSSWPPDEEIFIRYFMDHPEWKLIIAPHVIDEDHLQQIEKLLEGRNVVRYTKAHEAPSGTLEEASVLIIDCFGLLSSIYHYGQVAYVGGGFGVGIHNVVEAAVWGIPVFFGPNNQRFQEAQELKRNGGGIEIGSYDDFATRMNEFATRPESIAEFGQIAGNYVMGRAGATSKIFEYLHL
jgi:3-deoxy-D-manno-octulosonic-acid transferase